MEYYSFTFKSFRADDVRCNWTWVNSTQTEAGWNDLMSKEGWVEGELGLVHARLNIDRPTMW